MEIDLSQAAQIAREMIEGLARPHLFRIWCRETAAPGCQADWHTRHPSYGQCAVTALLLQDSLGGELMRADVPGFGSHYWNRLADGTEIDLTREQFPPGTVVPAGEPAPRSRLLEGERALAARTAERYGLLKRRSEALDEAVDEYMIERMSVGVMILGSDFFGRLKELARPSEAATGAKP